MKVGLFESSFLSIALVSCGAGTAAEAVRPKESTAAQALGEAECHDVARGGQPLVVDWSPEQRGDLEVAMKEGVAVVRYDCAGIELLSDCRLDGEYGYIGMTRKEQVVRLESADEVRANLPLTGGAIGGEMDRGATLDVAMVLVGKRRTTWSEPRSTDLVGKCDGATHYVRGASVGAFALATGSRAAVRASAEIFAAGTSGESTSKRETRTREGDPSDCARATPDSESPPAQCGAPVRLVLLPIAAGSEEPSGEAARPEAVVEAACPVGLVLAEGKCAKAESVASHQCNAGDRADCSSQCDKGHAGSCAELGDLLARSGETEPATAALSKACDGGDARGCALAGELARERDAVKATALFEKACTGGDAAGCTGLARLVAAKDPDRAAQLFGTACDGGEPAGCAEAGSRALGSGGVGRDVARARDLLRRACDGGQASSCAVLGELYEVGDPALPKQPILAELLFRRGCFRGSADACVGLGRALVTKPAGQPSPEARMWFERGCTGRSILGCAALRVAFGESRPVVPDPRQKQALFRACTGGNARACADSGLLDAASGNAAMAKPNLNRACTMGDAWACYLAKIVK